MSPPGARTGSSRLPSLTGMRFIAAFLVFFCHSSMQMFYTDSGVTEVTTRLGIGAGWLGVAFFFMLSGFVLTYSARPADRPTGFWRRRLVKIYPNHFVVWSAAVLLALLPGQPAEDGVTAAKVLPSLFLIHSWVPDIEVFNALHVPSWSLSCELLFYLAFPWLLKLVKRIRPGRLWFWAGGVVALIMLVPLLSQAFLPENPQMPWFPMSMWDYWAVYTAPPVRLLEFVLGVLMARIVLTGQWPGLRLGPACLLLALGCVVQWLLVPSPWAMVAPAAVPLALVIAAGATADLRLRTGRLGSRPMIRLGEISFALYLVHFLVLYYGHLVIGTGVSFATVPAVGIQLVLFVLTLVLAWLLYTVVERPAMRRWGSPHLTPDRTTTRRTGRDHSPPVPRP